MRYDIVVIDRPSDTVIGPFLDRGKALEWVMQQHAAGHSRMSDFDIMYMRTPEDMRA